MDLRYWWKRQWCKHLNQAVYEDVDVSDGTAGLGLLASVCVDCRTVVSWLDWNDDL